jgi:arylsulfatase A-like enzyme
MPQRFPIFGHVTIALIASLAFGCIITARQTVVAACAIESRLFSRLLTDNLTLSFLWVTLPLLVIGLTLPRIVRKSIPKTIVGAFGVSLVLVVISLAAWPPFLLDWIKHTPLTLVAYALFSIGWLQRVLHDNRTPHWWLLPIVITLWIGIYGAAYIRDKTLPTNSTQPNILLITMDTVRWDHVGFLGSVRPTTPFLDGLASQGTVFEKAWVQAPWTLPSMASIMTGQFPTQHGAYAFDGSISPSATTLAEALTEQGYDTGGVITNQFLNRKRGFKAGFRVFDDNLWNASHDVLTSQAATRTAIRIQQQLIEPYLLWVHYFDPHYTYLEHPDIPFIDGDDIAHLIPLDHKMIKRAARITKDDVDLVRAVYDEEIRHMDKAIQQLVTRFYEETPDSPTLIVAVADHGEQFMERGRIGHGKEIFEELVHTPLLIVGDGVPKSRNTHPVSASWIYDTLIAAGTGDTQATDLRAIAKGSQPNLPILIHGSYAWGTDHRSLGATDGTHKLTWHQDDDTWSLYNLDDDPSEQQNLWPSQLPTVTTLQQTLLGLTTKSDTGGKVDVTDDDLEQLRALGYLD